LILIETLYSLFFKQIFPVSINFKFLKAKKNYK